jgi:hypothetical protein
MVVARTNLKSDEMEANTQFDDDNRYAHIGRMFEPDRKEAQTIDWQLIRSP